MTNRTNHRGVSEGTTTISRGRSVVLYAPHVATNPAAHNGN
ncbi:hypothetical protein [Nocardia sp.]|nr:hypothetical protein [Nocardia sp.]